jgi:hypothetical protein
VFLLAPNCRCAGVYFVENTGGGWEANTAAGAKLIYGNPELGRFIRGMIRTDVNKLTNTKVNGLAD